jgi:dTDP-4-amino-4,6-dideoxygalactose transaminase
MNFIDLAAQRQRIAPEIDAAIGRVLSTCGFIMGPEVTGFEKSLAAFCGANHALACANGTDALLIPLRAWNIGPGDAVFVPSFTFVASAEVAPLVGASPVFVDVLPDTYNMDPASLEAAIESVKAAGKLTPRAIIEAALAAGVIREGHVWTDMLRQRNLLAHTEVQTNRLQSRRGMARCRRVTGLQA